MEGNQCRIVNRFSALPKIISESLNRSTDKREQGKYILKEVRISFSDFSAPMYKVCILIEQHYSGT